VNPVSPVRSIRQNQLSTIFLVARVELRRRLRQPLSQWTVAAFAVVACASVIVGTRDLAVRRDLRARQIADLAATQVRSPSQLLGWTPERALRVIRAPQLGSVITRGDDMSLPAYFDFGPAGAIWARDVPVDVAELETGRLFDLAFLARVLGGMIAVLVGVETVGAGRGRGTFQAWAALGSVKRPPTAMVPWPAFSWSSRRHSSSAGWSGQPKLRSSLACSRGSLFRSRSIWALSLRWAPPQAPGPGTRPRRLSSGSRYGWARR
jgi:hypothetical protein